MISLVFLESRKGLAIVIQNSYIYFVARGHENEASLNKYLLVLAKKNSRIRASRSRTVI